MCRVHREQRRRHMTASAMVIPPMLAYTACMVGVVMAVVNKAWPWAGSFLVAWLGLVVVAELLLRRANRQLWVLLGEEEGCYYCRLLQGRLPS